MTTLKDILALLAILACYGIAGRMDYDDAVRHEAYMRGRSIERLACAHDVTRRARTHRRQTATHWQRPPRIATAR